jgi:hypothetical protein
MKKVVVERPRWGSRQSNRKFSARLRYVPGHDYEEEPKKAYGFESHRIDRSRKYFAKEFTDVLGPLIGFLRKNVGRPWDRVYSELCGGLDKRKVTGLHIFQHLEDFVETNCCFVEGKPCHVGGWGGGYAVRWFYVHPRSGLLCQAPPKRPGARKARRAAALEEEVTFLRVNEETGYRKHEDIWYRVKLRRIHVRSWRPEDVVPVYDIFARKEARLGYGEHWVATEKKQCNRDELKRVGYLLRERERRIKNS